MLTAILRSLRTGVVTIGYPEQPARAAGPFPWRAACAPAASSTRFRRRRSALRAPSPGGTDSRAMPSTSARCLFCGRCAGLARGAHRDRTGGRTGRAGAASGWWWRSSATPMAVRRNALLRPRASRSPSGSAYVGPFAASAAPRAGIVQRLRLGVDGAAEPGLRRAAPRHRLRRLAAPCRRRHRHRARYPQPGDGGPPDLRGGPRAAGGDRRRRLRHLGRHGRAQLRQRGRRGRGLAGGRLHPGCPPRPEAIIFGILLAIGRMAARRR